MQSAIHKPLHLSFAMLYFCPTGAICKIDLKEKQKTRIGLAVFEKNLCLVAAEHRHMPWSNRSIRPAVFHMPAESPA